MSDATRTALLAMLADGEMHAGPALASHLGVSRTAVWKLVADLRQSGVGIVSVERRGYRLAEPCELLDAAAIRRAGEQGGRALPGEVEVLFDVDSTNEYLHAAPAPRAGHPRIVFAEIQRSGRGRRGRSWLAPFGSGLTFSIAWSYPDVPAQLSALSLAIGVTVADTLRAEGAREAMLKWPNDIVWRGRKLGGLLIQLKLEAGGAASVVVGLGLNLSMPEPVRASLATPDATPVADLREAIAGRGPGRNALAGRLVAAMCEGLERFGREGFAPWAARWQELDSLSGLEVRVTRSGGSVEGRALGADHDGALRVEVGGRVERYYAGDVSLRAVPGRAA
jgi:BirA family transcriptional regulator, biotin operon repressor / biotin---[acetyl-CoA-carboxylase] ligase